MYNSQRNNVIIVVLDDFNILRFLRVCKFDVDKTKERLRNYYEHKAKCPEWFTNRDPFLSEIQEILDLGYNK